MSLTRSPRHNNIRRLEEQADNRKTFNLIIGLIGFCSLCFVAAILIMAGPK